MPLTLYKVPKFIEDFYRNPLSIKYEIMWYYNLTYNTRQENLSLRSGVLSQRLTQDAVIFFDDLIAKTHNYAPAKRNEKN